MGFRSSRLPQAGPALALALVCLFSALVAVRADDNPAHDDFRRHPDRHQDRVGKVYALAGEHTSLGRFDSVLTITPRSDGKFDIDRHVTYRDGQDERRSGVGERDAQGVLTANLIHGRGMKGALERGPQLRQDARIVIRGEAIASTVTDTRGKAQASGTLVGERVQKGKPKRLQGRLLAVAKDALKDALEDGVDLSTRFNLTDFFSVGVSSEVALVRSNDLSGEQREQQARAPRTAWVATSVEGGVRLPITGRIPLGGPANISLGVGPGTRMRYRVVDLYPIPAGATDARTVIKNLKRAAKRSFDLPLTASEARALLPGAVRTLEGDWNVALSGRLGVGYALEEIDKVVRVGASARVGGFYHMREKLSFQVARLRGDQVRLTVTHCEPREQGGGADLLLGAALGDEDEIADELDLPDVAYIEPLAKRVGEEILDFLRVQLDRERKLLTDKELEVSWRFDLSQSSAAEAYEQAMQGDLTAAAEAARQPGSGVVEDYRLFELEETTISDADVKLSQLIKAGARRQISLKDLVIEDRDGRRRYDVFRFDRSRKFGFFGKKWQRDVALEVVRPVRLDGELSQELGRGIVRVRYRIRDEATRKSELARLHRVLTAWGLSPGELPEPRDGLFRSAYGRTRSSLAVDIAEEGIAALTHTTPQNRFQAYVKAYELAEGEAPLWATAAGRQQLERELRDLRFDDRNSARAQRYERMERELKRAEQFTADLGKVSRTADRDERARLLTRMAHKAGWKLTAVTALVELTPKNYVSARAVIDGKRANFRGEKTGDGFVDMRPDLRGR